MKRFRKVSVVAALATAIVVVLVGPSAALATTTTGVNLGAADRFAILSYDGITDAGGTSRILAGDIGTYPASGAAIGLLTSQMTGGGTIFDRDGAYPYPGPGVVTDPVLLNDAKNAIDAAYNDASGRSQITVLPGDDNQLGGQTLPPGVYSFSAASNFNLIGTLRLDPAGDPDPNWIFLAESTLKIDAGAQIVLLGDATPCDVFWRVPSSATIDAGAHFIGNIMAYASIELKQGAILDGTALARTESVTLIDNDITKGPCALAPPATPVVPVVPGMPYTGSGPDANTIRWSIALLATAILAGIFGVSFVLRVYRRKKVTS